MSRSSVIQNRNTTNNTLSFTSLIQSDRTIQVYVRLVFLRIGEIDTLNEKYQAHASIESRWIVSFDQFSSIEQDRLLNGKSLVLEKYTETHWHPQLYIENGLGDLKEQIKYSAKLNKIDKEIYICEHRIVKGLFWEKLELYHFPTDVQDLSISITSMLFHDRVLLLADPYSLSGINREAFVDQQEWSLYEHVNTEQRFIKDFLFRTGDDDENENDGDNETIQGKEDRKRSVLTVTCHAARKSTYFYWNGYFLIFMITFVSFCTFGMPMQVAINRLQVSCTLLLTSVTFRWTVNRSLPTVSYLTSLDKYGIICMLILVSHSIWHGMISTITWVRTTDYRAAGDLWISYVDHVAFYVFMGIFITIHIILIIWFFCVPFRYRKKMRQNDYIYRAQKTNSRVLIDW
ncbi:hypothetical protein I4U23_012238 [Adineta vaga]|nr:hypothetical protein I4U23_012238 [Adineta vaga]